MLARSTSSIRPFSKTLAAAALAVTLAFSAATALATAPEAAAAPSARSAVLANSKAGSAKSYSFTNRKRVVRGIRSLKRVGHLNKVARKQARRMARSQRMHHNPNLSREVKNWCTLGENVAFDQTVKQANRGLWHSPGHRANMLSSRFSQMGTGVAVDSRGTRWVVQVFRRPC